MITCQLCGEEFKQIHPNHLRSVHNVSYWEYVERFPNSPVIDDDIRRSISERITAEKLGNNYGLACNCSAESNKRRAEAFLGKHHTIEAKLNLSEQLMGHPPAVFTEESRRKISETHTGKVNSPETIHLMSEAAKERWKNPIYQEHQMESWHRKPTQPELDVQSVLDKCYSGEWKYVGDGQVWIGGRNPDFINVNSKKQVIEVFGVFWHDESEVAERIAHYRQYGFSCLVIWEFDTLNENTIVNNIKNM